MSSTFLLCQKDPLNSQVMFFLLEEVITPDINTPEDARVYQMTEEERAERDARVERSWVKEDRRDKERESFPVMRTPSPLLARRILEAEEELSGVRERPGEKTTHTADNGQKEILLSVMGALSMLSPNTLNCFNAYIQSISSKPSFTVPDAAGSSSTGLPDSESKTKTGSSLVKTSDQEDLVMNEEDDFFVENLKAPESILALLRVCCHVPLTVCISEFLRKISVNETNKYVKIQNSSMEKLSLLDITQWDNERSISIEDWHEAWRNYIKTMRPLDRQGKITTLFKNHYKYLQRQKEINTTLEMILEFDIEIHQIFFMSKRTHFIVSSPAYETKFQMICSDVVEQKISQDLKKQCEPY
ncbi:hypothetical protein BDY19DRAFT_910627 [Irpex rosettiformis]|uniref:Uncharacterized protein n=1 Tax=Irpex rosettiformis TaxID=378272 RepID=A0ACB8TN73_9APHY|nr:hypothetical protein BDY19DRAFT_910627 [Irpex rosettiformis]